MLIMFTQKNNQLPGENMTAAAHMYRLTDRDLLRRLMRRTGTGHSITTRGLATAAGVSHGTIGMLLTGAQRSLPCDAAHAVAQAIGVDDLILWTPTGRAVSAEATAEAGTP